MQYVTPLLSNAIIVVATGTVRYSLIVSIPVKTLVKRGNMDKAKLAMTAAAFACCTVWAWSLAGGMGSGANSTLRNKKGLEIGGV